jgi:hypothetical protein
MVPLLPVFALAVVEIWAAVPAGLALGQSPAIVWATTVTGSVIGVTIVATAGSALRTWLARRGHRRLTSGTGRLSRLWAAYGVIGWGLLSPLFMAPAMGTAVALVLGAPRRRVLIVMCTGVLIWTTLLVAAGTAGIEVLRTLGNR